MNQTNPNISPVNNEPEELNRLRRESQGQAPRDMGGVEIKKYLTIFRRKWYLIALTTVLGLAAAYYNIQSTEPIYQATATFELIVNMSSYTPDGVFTEGRSLSAESKETFLIKAQSPEVKKRAEEIVREKREFAQLSRAKLLDRFTKRIQPQGGSRILRIITQHGNPNLAAAFANAYVEAIRRISIEENREREQASVAGLNDQEIMLRNDLDLMDAEIRRLRKASNFDKQITEQNNLQNDLGNITSKSLEYEGEIAHFNELITYLNNTELTTENLENLPASVAQIPEIRNALSTLANAEKKLAALLVRYKPKHPAVEAQEKTIALNRLELKEATKQALTIIETDKAFMETQIVNLKKRQETIQSRLSELNIDVLKINQQIDSEIRERGIVERNLQNILSRIKEKQIRADEQAINILPRIKANPSANSISAGPKKVFKKYAFIGAIIGILLAYGSHKLDDFIWSPEDIEQSVGVKVLALLPRMKLRDRSQLAKVCTTRKSNLFTEVFTGLRGVLTSGGNRNAYSSLLVTSCSPQEGKTICSTNLAIMYALGGTKTLLIDFDTRIPRIHRIFGFTATDAPNLLAVLSEKKSEEFPLLPLKTDITNLDVICSFPDSSFIHAELMGSPFLADFLRWAKSNYEQIIIDSPPFGAVSDSNIIGGMVDGVIMVVGQKKSRKTTLIRATQQFRDYGANLVGIIMNGIKQKGGKYNYYYGYGYGGYSYSYTGSYGTSEKKQKV